MVVTGKAKGDDAEGRTAAGVVPDGVSAGGAEEAAGGADGVAGLVGTRGMLLGQLVMSPGFCGM